MKEKIFEALLDVTNVSDLTAYIADRIQDLDVFFHAPYSQQEEQREVFERFILFRCSIINEIDYGVLHNRSFILMLLDLCERHGAYSCVSHLVNIIQANGININSRMRAGLEFTYPEPKSNAELVKKLPVVCELLESAYQNEDDDEKALQITLLDFFDHVFYNTNSTYAQQLITDYQSIKGSLSFVKGLDFLVWLNPKDGDNAHDIIQSYIAKLHNIGEIRQKFSEEDFVIENGTDYSNYLQSINVDFWAQAK